MANERKLTFLKSNYTLRTKHKTLNKKNTDIYVRDYMVTTNNGGWDSGSIPYGESNFKMIHRFDEKQVRKHSYGKWLSNGESDVWTLENIQNALSKYDNITEINKENVMNTAYKSLLDFAYFGSCTQLIKSSITDIINNFPGELYVTNKTFSYYSDTEEDYITIVGDETNGHDTVEPLYYIENPFNIDIFTTSISPSNDNGLKYFCESRNSYKVLNKHDTPCGIDMQRWIVEMQPNVDLRCLQNGQFVAKVLLLGEYNGENIVYNIDKSLCEDKLYTNSTFIVYVYFNEGEFIYLTDSVWEGYHVRLSDEKVDDFYKNKLDDFQRFILNRDTKPRYLIKLETLKETETGFKTGTMKLNWPTREGGWNLDIESLDYEIYIDKLLSQAELYDEYYSNNLWRMMTHDSIKNMDLTFDNEKLDEDKSDYNIGTSKMEGLFWVYGREFDDLKRYIDNIKCINNVSYSDNGSTADSLLRENCSSSGWELYDPTQYLNQEVEVKQLFKNQFKLYSLSDVKNRFFKELFLNSKSIFSRKGTKYGIEMLLSLFGFCSYEYAKNSYPNLSPNEQLEGKKKWEDLNDGEKQLYYDYTIDEFVAVATNKSSDVVNAEETLPCAEYNALKAGFFDTSEFTEVVNPFEGLPVREVEFVTIEGLQKKYIIPWYDKLQYNSNRMYFQMYGGWGKVFLKEIDETINITQSVKQHFSELRSTSDFKIYSETLKYIKVKANLQDLFRTPYSELNEGDIYYINTPIGDEYHYYVLNNKEKSGSLLGWTPVTVEDFENKTKNALSIVYLETIIDDYRANNPHVGYGKYDDGNEYLEYFRHLFKYEIDNSTADNLLFNESAYDCNTGEVLDDIKNCGFTIGDIVKDNVKTWYFSPTNIVSKMPIPNAITKYPNTLPYDISVIQVTKDINKIKGMDTWIVSYPKESSVNYYTVLSVCDMKKVDPNKEYTLRFWIKNSDAASIRIKAKLGYAPNVEAFGSKKQEDAGSVLYKTIVLGLNEERYIEITGYPFKEQYVQIFIGPEYQNKNTGGYYRIQYSIGNVYLTETNGMTPLYKDEVSGIYELGDFNEIKENKIGAIANGYTHYESDLLPFNLETQEVYSNDEAAANSIINVKNLKISFANKYTNFDGFKPYLYNVIVPYVTQLIPSTTILDVEFEGVESSDTVMYDIVPAVGIV